MRSERDRAKERIWRRILRQWRRSGLSVRQFCTDRAVSEPSFYAWRRTISERDRQASRGSGERHGSKAAQELFVPVRVADSCTPAQARGLEVALGGGRVLRVPVSFDASTLRQLLAVLEEAPSC